MSPSHVLEPTYAALKRRLMAGDWPMGARLESARLADELGVSITPVRDSLNRLTGEGLVEARTGGGFHVARFNEQGFRDLLELNLTLLSVSLVAAKVAPRTPPRVEPEDDLARRTAGLFEQIACAADNVVLLAMVRNLNERLHAARCHDRALFPATAEELAGIEECIAGRHVGEALRARLTHYHDNRARAAARYIALLERVDR